MPAYNPSLVAQPGHTLTGTLSRQLKADLARAHDAVQSLVDFVNAEHLSMAVFSSYWRKEARAALTLQAVGQSLGVDLAVIADDVFRQLERTSDLSLTEFQAEEAPDLFASIDSIEPDEVSVGDGRAAAEKFQYAVEARAMLLHYSLVVLNQRYPASSFSNLAEASMWVTAYSALLQEAEEIVTGTQHLLYDQATAVQSYLDTTRNRFVMLEEQARAAGAVLREDWRGLLERTENDILDLLALRQERLEAIALGGLDEGRQSRWPGLVRRAPGLGSLALMLAGGASILAPQMIANGVDSLSLSGAVDEAGRATRNFPVIARRSEPVSGDVGMRARDEIAQFFAMQPRPRGRHTLTISDSWTLERVLDEMASFGYARRDVLKLLGMNSVTDLAGPIALDIRWSQGGRPLLLPPYQPAPGTAEGDRPSAMRGVPLSVVAQRFGFTEQQIFQENAGLSASSGLHAVALPQRDWTAGAVIETGAGLDGIAAELGIAMQDLADLNDIPNPDTWRYEGQPLRVPVISGETSNARAPVAASDAPARFEGEARPVSSLVVHRVVAGDTLDALAARYETTIAALLQDNALDGNGLESGRILLVRVPGHTVPVAQEPLQMRVTSGGSFPAARVPAAVAPVAVGTDLDALVQTYGSTVYPTIDAMPEEVRSYFTSTIQEVADFFNVRPGDIIGILQAENNNTGLRIHQPAVSSAGAKGVAQIIARTWNGWSNPQTATHISDLRSIEQHGGLGFDWSMREAWREWKAGNSDGSVLADANADPDRFENSVAGIARHLVHYGLTRDRAQLEPDWFERALADAISVYNSGRPLAVAADYRQSSANAKTTGQYVREAMAIASATPVNIVHRPAPSPLRDAFERLMDQTFGVALTEGEVLAALDASPVAAQVARGELDAETGARKLVEQTALHYMAEGQRAREQGEPLPWPFVYDQTSLFAQHTAVKYLGVTLPPWELDSLLMQANGDRDQIARALAGRADARLFAGARLRFDQLLRRGERGLPVPVHEVAAVVQPGLAGHNPQAMNEQALQGAMDRVEHAIRQLPEYRQVNGFVTFSALPLSPMPRVFKGFGAPVDYQQGGRHTGIDLANPLLNGQEPAIYAVEAGTVAHVGPLYCDRPNACRGGNSIIIDHGDHVYSIYSHNSLASVTVGQTVRAGQEIGQQGNEGYSFGSHLHFEVHTGAPFSGDWERPFHGGQFEDPMQWLPVSPMA
jgi:murein DD-endopeptidase MepM/ murein hydrolase activator NlpD/LysM repeat protein